MNELFSVIITTCNREVKILKQAIDSVVNQSYPNIEIIVINDSPNNPDNHEINKLVYSYSGGIKYYVNKEQVGANCSRNYGMQTSKGKYISFLDDDDYWDKTRIEKCVQLFQKGYDIVYSDFVILSEKRSRYSKRTYPSSNEAIKLMLASNYLGGFSNVSFTRKCFIESKMLDERMLSYQDQDLFVRMLQHGKIGYINEALSYYRITENSISLNPSKKLSGLVSFMSKYSDLYNKYPESKKRRLESELIYSAKQGWKKNKKEIKKLLLPYDSKLRLLYLDLIGTSKRVAVNILKLQ